MKDSRILPFFLMTKKIKIHKNIVVVASYVFFVMLESNSKKFQKEKVIINNFDYKTVKICVNFMYTKNGQFFTFENFVEFLQIF